MRLTLILNRQHIGRHFVKHWYAQHKRKLLQSGAEEVLKKNNIPYYNAEEIAYEKPKFEKINVVGYKNPPIKFDKTHPNWNDRLLLTYKDDNVLLEGLKQAQVLTNTVKIDGGLPDEYQLTSVSKDINNRVKNIILNSHIFDAEQKKLPVKKDPTRPAWNFPRDYGITYERRNKLMVSQLLHLIECNESYDVVKQRYTLHDLHFQYSYEKDDNLIQFELTGDTLLVSKKPLNLICYEQTQSIELPELHPIGYTVTLNEENVYQLENIYPIKKNIQARHPHTLFIHYDKTKVSNVFGEEVTENQIYGRSLLKTYTAAASFAKQEYGEDVGDLPEPVNIHCVQTDGRLFHFGILQLNTLNVHEDCCLKNIWYQTELLPLFENCSYERGSPVLTGYNNVVVKHLISFYSKT